MKILLVDNNTEYKRELAELLSDHEVETQKYRPGLEFRTKGKDLVILSGGGGEGREIYDVHSAGHLWYQDQIDFVRKYDKPLLGICMGFEIICKAYGAKVEEMPKALEGTYDLVVTKEGQDMLALKKIKQYEGHKWRVKQTPKGFKVLAKSPTGIELIKHKKKPMWATQFHPEKGGTLDLKTLVKQADNG